MVSKKTFIAVVITVFLAFWFKGIGSLDPDFGWHIQMGKLIEARGVPMTDPFSYTMPSFRYINHEWLTDVLLNRGLSTIGWFGLGAVFSILAVVALLIAVPSGGYGWAVVPVLAAATVLLPRAGVRPQVESWVFLAILFRLLAHDATWKRWRWLVPVFFCIWANLHGGFAMGIFLLGLVIFLKTVQYRRLDIKDLLVWGLGVVASFVNPYGPRLWMEIWMTVSDSHLRFSISEWLPFFATVELGFWLLVVLAGMLIFHYRKSVSWWWLGVLAFLLISGIASLRHMALFVIVAVNPVTDLWRKFCDETRKRSKVASVRLEWFSGVLIGMVVVLWGWSFGWETFGVFSGKRPDMGYPVEAIKFLKQENLSGEIFTEYAWGGYMIWSYPEKKVFIDGRMPSLRWGVWPEKGEAPDGEASWAFKDFLKIIEDGDYKQYFEKYNVRVLMWPEHVKNENADKFNNLLAKVGMSLKKEVYDGNKLIEAVTKDGWNKVYSDGTAVIYAKK